MHENIPSLCEDLPAKCAMICKTLTTKDQELRNIREQFVHNTQITEVLFDLMGKMRTLLSSYEQEQKQGLDLEPALELAGARLELQSLKIDYDTLRQENAHLREALETQHIKGGDGHV